MKKKRTTVGRATVCDVYGIEVEDMNSYEKTLAAKITALVKRAVREGYDAGFVDGSVKLGCNDGWNQLAKKHGMRGVE